jgi:hypothetical protein
MRHSVGISTVVAAVLFCFGLVMCAEVAEAAITMEQLVQEREAAKHRDRRLILNNDGGDVYDVTQNQARTVANYLGKRTTPILNTQVDSISYCTGVFDYYSNRMPDASPGASRLWALSDYTPSGVNWSYATELGNNGTPDTLATMTSYGHANNKEMFWSMRMNDTHDTANPNVCMSPWKDQHHNYMMAWNPKNLAELLPYGGHRWSALDYEIEDVRNEVYNIISAVAGNSSYNLDGIELDFDRHPVYFKPQMTGQSVTQAECDLMTGLMRQVRTMTEQVGMARGRPLLISVRVPDSVGFSKAIGLDLNEWLDEGLVDMVSAGDCQHLEPWRNLVSLGHSHDVPVYACLSASRIAHDPLLWRGEAGNAWSQGVNGINMFNYFDYPDSELLNELGSPQTLAGLPQTYQWNSGSQIQSPDYWLKNGSQYIIPDVGYVAEPSTIMLLLAGGLAMGAWRRARGRARFASPR